MLAVIAAVAFVVALILHLMRLDSYVTLAFVYGGLVFLALSVVYPYTPWAGRRTRVTR